MEVEEELGQEVASERLDAAEECLSLSQPTGGRLFGEEMEIPLVKEQKYAHTPVLESRGRKLDDSYRKEFSKLQNKTMTP